MSKRRKTKEVTDRFNRMMWLWVGVGLAAADIPVNCNYREVLGNWRFYVSGDTHQGSLYNPETSCGHGQPDRIAPILEGESWSLPDETAVEVRLEEPNRARSGTWGLGSWTM